MKSDDDIITESFSAQPASLRIALVTETFAPEVNGVAMTLGHLVQGLLKRHHEVQVVRPRQPPRAPAPAPQQGLDEVLAKGVPIPSYGELRFGLPSGNRLLRLWQQRRPDLVHVATEGPLGWSAVATARKLKLPVTSSFHTNFQTYSSHYGLGLLKVPIDAYLRKLHNRTLATLVPTQMMADDLAGRGYRNLGILSRGVALEHFSPALRSDALRAQWGLQDGALAVIHVGRLAQEKNIAQVLRAFEAIQTKRPDARLVLVGDGPLRKATERSMPQAIFAGMRTGADLAAHYASADLFLFPSLSETYGNVVPEALASGLAVVSYARAAALQLIVHGHNGMLAPPGDERQFVAAALELCTEPELLALVRRRGPSSVAHLDWDAVCETFLRTLRSVLERHEGSFAHRPALLHAA